MLLVEFYAEFEDLYGGNSMLLNGGLGAVLHLKIQMPCYGRLCMEQAM